MVGNGRASVIEDGHTIRDDAVSLPKFHRSGPPVASIAIGLARGSLGGSLVRLDAADRGRGRVEKDVAG